MQIILFSLLIVDFSLVAFCLLNSSENLTSNDHAQAELHLFEEDILLTSDDLRFLRHLFPPGRVSSAGDRRLDSEMTDEGFMPFQEIQQRRKRRAATAIASKLWQNATIPYIIGSSVTEAVKENILQAMEHWQSNTCIRFVKRKTEENFLLFERGPCGCCSYVGRKGVGPQEVTLSPQCASYGVVIHELGHVIGFWHEHSRPDRDQFIKILRENIIQEKLENFDKKSAIEIDMLGELYDYESIMHYRKKTFSSNGQDTMVPNMVGVKIGQRRGLSSGDIAQTRLLYKCPKPRCYEEFNSIENSFTSPNYPQKYFRDYECTWVIRVAPGELVTLEFIDFAIERSPNCSYDYIEIREGDDGTGKLIGRMCGEGVPGTFQVLNSVWINFVSDSEYNFRGFWAHYFKTVVFADIGSGEADESGDSPLGLGGQPVSVYMANCNQVLRDVMGSVSSPLMPIMYGGPAIECSWSIDGGENASRIQLTITNKTPEGSAERCLGDVYEMTPGRKTQTNRRTDKKPNRTIRKKTESISVNNKSRFKPTLVTYDCHQQNTLLLASHSVSIQWSSHVNQPIAFSYIIDYDECRFSPSPCQHSCENTLTSFICYCNRGYYLNDDQRTCSAKVLPPASDKCGEIVFSERGSISVTNWTNLRDCSWYIQPQDDLRVFLTFVKFFIPLGISSHTCLENYVEIQVGKNQTSRVKYCDRRVPPALALPPGNVMIRLRTKFHRLGIQPQFTAYYLFYKNSASDCQKKIKGQGEVVYPEFSKEYGPYSLCTWYVSARPGYRLRLHFVEMDVEPTQGCHFDFIQVRNGHHPTSPLKGHFCGQDLPRDVITGNQMLVMFASDRNGSGRGFKAIVTSEKHRRKAGKEKKKKSTVLNGVTTQTPGTTFN